MGIWLSVLNRRDCALNLQFLGTGTPLGEQQRLQACLLLSFDDHRVLIDCGMTTMVALARYGIDPESIDAVIVSHLHGDHFGGLPPLLLGRTAPLAVLGPPDTAVRVERLAEAFAWGLRPFDFLPLQPRQTLSAFGLDITAYPVPHNPLTQPSALRIQYRNTVIAYSGDAGWSQSLIEASENADLFICAIWSFDSPDPTFLDYQTLRAHKSELSAQRIILTHLGPSALAHQADLEEELAFDGLAIELQTARSR